MVVQSWPGIGGHVFLDTVRMAKLGRKHMNFQEHINTVSCARVASPNASTRTGMRE